MRPTSKDRRAARRAKERAAWPDIRKNGDIDDQSDWPTALEVAIARSEAQSWREGVR